MSASVALGVAVAEQSLADRVRVRVRDLAAEEADRERGHGSGMLPAHRTDRPPISSCVAAANVIEAGEHGTIWLVGSPTSRACRQPTRRSELGERRQVDVRKRRSPRREERSVRASTPRAVQSAVFAAAFRRVAVDRGLRPSRSRSPARSRAWQPRSRVRLSHSPRRARSRARAEQELEAELRRRMSAGAERLAGVDHELQQPRRRRLPGRPDPERPDRWPARGSASIRPPSRPGRARSAPSPKLSRSAIRTRLVRVRDELDLRRRPAARQSPRGRARACAPSPLRPDRGARRPTRGRGSAEGALELLEEALVGAVGLLGRRCARTRRAGCAARR